MGRAVNPLIVRGQVHGGVAQGFGQAVLEHTAFDPDSGQLLSGSFMDYALPRASDLPDIEVELVEVVLRTVAARVAERGEGDLPPVALGVQAAGIGHEHVVEEDLVEARPAGHLPQRPHGHAVCVHVHQERGQVAVPRLVGGTADDLADVGQVRA